MKKQRSSIPKILGYSVFLVTLFFVIAVFVKYGEHYLNADISSQLVFADYVNKEGEFFPKGWFYSTEIELFAQLYSFFLHFFPNNWHMVRTCVVFISALILSISFLFMAKVLSCDYFSTLLGLSAILLPFSSGYMFLMTYGCFYQFYTATIFFDIGIILRMHQSKYRILCILAMAIVNIYVSLSGMRMLVINAVPIGIVCVLLFIRRVLNSESWERACASREWSIFIGGMLSGLFIMIGCVLNRFLFTNADFSMDNYTTTLLRQFTFPELLIHIQYMLEYLGFIGDIPMVSFNGIVSVITLVLFPLVLISPIILINYKKQLSLSLEDGFLTIYTIIAVFMGILLNVTTPKGRQAGSLGVCYYMAGFLALIFLTFILIAKIPSKMKGIHYSLVICLFLIFGVKSISTIRNEMQTGETQYEEAADWLVSNEYTEGFAPFWNANVLTEASNGKIEVWTIWDLKDAEIYHWLQAKSHAAVLPQGKCFVYVTSEDVWNKKVDTVFMESIASESVLLPCDDRLYLFDSGEEYIKNFR